MKRFYALLPIIQIKFESIEYVISKSKKFQLRQQYVVWQCQKQFRSMNTAIFLIHYRLSNIALPIFSDTFHKNLEC